ncbi:hypothetical protein ACFFWC_19905 [Plantactinospora siamensis]|uniref:DUF4267 domain-containing protein n=1 Tax=Plantactinospora siamensis TaxID=555372 RepID=A0ABV6P2N8_9ACTN
MTRAGSAAVRAGAVARMIWGAGMLAAPTTVLGALGGRRSDLAVAVLRVLGARHLAQGAVTAWRPTGPVLAAGAAADALHGASTVLLVALDRRQRGPAVAETGLAAAWIALTLSARR